MNEDVAVSCMKAGADDYVIKGHIKRLGEAIIAAMNKKENEFKRKEAENELRKTLEELQKSRNQLRELNNRIQQVREKERKEISREIHDVIGQSLTALKYDVFWVGKNVIKTEEYSKKIEEMDILISETIQFTQKLSSKLRPELIDTLGFKSALTELLSEFEKRTHIKTKLYFPQEFKNFDPDISMTLFRITQECLTNVARHAKADKVKLVLKKSSSGIYFIISDNGIGISQEKITNIKSLGLLGITERVYSINSNIEIIGKDNKGTNIIIHVPKERIKDNTL
jgi:two-component system sensor histidine kinase UhpB